MNDLSLDSIDFALLDQLQADASRSNQALADIAGISPATCLRRVKRLVESGLIARQVALLDTDRVASVLGHGISVIVEVSLDRQDTERLDAFEAQAATQAQVQQCYRVSPGPDFILIVRCHDMPDYDALARRLFHADTNVRNVKAFFSVKRSKFVTALPLPLQTTV
ncbi:Lrp/AsnC family transcriptional regulator [Xylophilus sp. GOD-11R]|uniref:Lrp/AsnC family transcriptional regulator n=1 Tax=Xylophilus sp. GOD-11R TaxID=3089814 RepID=UPI00298CF79A|nr:Lrp/AsnC family transcriptional regulator [Xylophilus sp. GOD-11R]WPB56325.1 Lrp/AsnC family transcriptional regulator [Xylophilus sp. GOD-11R]